MPDSYTPLYEIEPEELRPTAAEWRRHGLWFFLTFFTTTLAGTLFPFGTIDPFSAVPAPTNWLEWIILVPTFFSTVVAAVAAVCIAHPEILLGGLKFSLSLLAILTAHEFGHYIACRLYGVKSSLPYFIPLPILSPAGTLGAVIRIQSPMPTHRAIFDIGVAGPIAGFIVIIPIAFLGLATMQIAPPSSDFGLTFADPLFTRLLGAIIGVDPTRGYMNSFLAAAWVGLLVTSLNLLPASQLDGGHAVYAALGEKIHFWTGRIAFAAMVLLTIIGVVVYQTPGPLIFTILLAILLKIPHPEPLIDDSLDLKRKIIAVITLIIFVLSFMPFPIHSNESLFKLF